MPGYEGSGHNSPVDCCLLVWGRPNDKAQGADGSFIAGGSPGAAGSAAHVETGDGNGTN